MSQGAISQPHDRLIRFTLGSKENAVSFFQGFLPPALAAAVDWEGLELEHGTYVDATFRQSESDLLYRVPFQTSEAGGGELLIYLLVEHQSTGDRWLPLRLFGYMHAIWSRRKLDHPEEPGLPLLLPIVISQIKGGWPVSAHFSDLLRWPEGQREALDRHIPAFEYLVIDLAKLSYGELAGNPTVQAVLGLLKAAAEKQMIEWIDQAASILQLISDRETLYALFLYAANAESNLNLKDLAARVSARKLPLAASAIMSIAEQLRTEGRQEGRGEGILIGLLIAQIHAQERLLKRAPSSLEDLAQLSVDQLRGIIAQLERECDAR